MPKTLILTAFALIALAWGPAASAQRVQPASALGANPPPVAAPLQPRTSAPAPYTPSGAAAALPYGAPAGQTPAAAAAAASTAGVAADSSTDKNYILGPADVIEVSVLGRTEYVSRSRISEDGTIQLQYLGTVTAANRTAAQLSEDVAKALEKGGFFTSPIVRVDVVSYASRYVTVLGNFGSPGLVPVDRAYRLSEIVARVGGVKEAGSDYVILTPKNGTERRLTVATLATGGVADDPYVSAGDKIYAPPAELFYVTGQIKGPGAFAVIKDMTFRMALSRAGGVTDSGSEKKLSVTRKGVKLAHVDLDSKVEAGDVINVGERLF